MSETRPLRIFHVFRAPVGGLFRHVTDLADEQSRQGHQVGLICDSSTGGVYESEILAALEKRLALGLLRIPMRRQISPADLAVTRRLLAHIRSAGCDVLHGHGAKGGAYARLMRAFAGSRQPMVCIYTPHGGSLHFDPASIRGMTYFTAERILERFTDAIIHVSTFEAEIYRSKVHTPHCVARVIRNGVHEAEFAPVTPHADARSLLFLGAFRTLKGIDVFLHAVAKLAAGGVDVTANLVGQPEGRQHYSDLAAALGIADRTAFFEPMPARAAFASARAVVVPSLAESMPYIVLEAIAARMPLIATNVGGIPEIFGPRAGELVQPGDVDGLANAIGALMADPLRAQHDARARREWLHPRFNIETMQRDILTLYRAVLAQKTAPAR